MKKSIFVANTLNMMIIGEFPKKLSIDLSFQNEKKEFWVEGKWTVSKVDSLSKIDGPGLQ